MALVIALIAACGALPAKQANANCVCRCVNGSVQAICSSAIDLPPICAPTICPIAPSSIAPIGPPTVPPVGTSHCTQQQVLNPYTNRYEWRQVCQ